RTAVGGFTLAEAASPDEVTLLSLPQAVRDYPQSTVDAATAALIANGRVLERSVLGVEGEGPWAILGPDGALLAMYEPRGPRDAKPAVVVT
ncbi:MAG: hypothetical protein ABMA25_23630, partial [Ilumatobacteraceae bacterium]